MNALREKIKQAAKDSAHELTTWRRHLHRHPELSFQEFETAAYIEKILHSWGIQTERKATTGIVGIIEGKAKGKTIALRADMDALPITEQNKTDYASANVGVMHACGHDVHTTCLLGAVKILNTLKNEWSGCVKFIFQPGEEKNPGGASLLIEEHVLENPKVDGIIGQHVFPFLPVGKIGFREGKYMASSDELYLTVKGKGGHGAMPENTIDPVLILSHIIVALQQIVSRNANPKQPSVLTFGRLEANGATNIIPDEAKAAGTFRTMDEAWRKKGLQNIERMAKQLAESMGGSCEVEISHGYPCLINEENLTKQCAQSARDYVGEENVVAIDLSMSSEDFAFYSQKIPAVFYRLGTRNEARGIVSGVHTATFDIDESALELGAGLMAWNAIQVLK